MGPSRQSEARAPVRAYEKVMVNVVTPYQTVDFSLTADDLSIEWPRSFLGVVPIGRARLEIPLSELLSMRLIHTVAPTRLIVVVLLASLLVVFDHPRWLSAIIMILGIWFLLLAVIGATEVIHTGGRSVVPVCLLQSRTARDFIDEVDQATGTSRQIQP